MNQQVGVEAIFQGAAKGARGVFERGEKLGINQAVRDAMGEIRRNVSGFNESRQSPRLAGDVSAREAPALTALAALEQRNRQLASMLDETVTSLKEVSASNLEDKNKSLELIEVAAAKVQFVKIYLEDPSMEVPAMEAPAEQDQMQVDKDEDDPGSAAEREESDLKISSLTLADDKHPEKEAENMEVEVEKPTSSTATLTPTDPLSTDSRPAGRPGPIPTRSTLAQSSFSWMLEPNETSMPEPRTASKSPSASNHKKGPSNSASRERSAFLFGEVTSGSDSPDNLRSDDIFGMEPIRKNKSATPF
jgi:TBC1 domain family protein 5